MNKLIGSIIAMALVVIALNATYTNTHKAPEKAPAQIEEKVLPVMGHVTFPFNAGTELGLLVKDGEKLKILRYDAGSLFSVSKILPTYVTYRKLSNGQDFWKPVILDKLN